MRKVLELNGKTEILSIPNISMKPQNNIIFSNFQDRLSVSFIIKLFFLFQIFIFAYKILRTDGSTSVFKHHERRINNRGIRFIDFLLFFRRERSMIYLIIILSHTYPAESDTIRCIRYSLQGNRYAAYFVQLFY